MNVTNLQKNIAKKIKKLSCKNIFTFSICVFILSIFSQLFVSNRIAVKGKEMVDLDHKKVQLTKEISELELEISHYSSLAYIEKVSKNNGFVENTNYVLTIDPVTTTARAPSF